MVLTRCNQFVFCQTLCLAECIRFAIGISKCIFKESKVNHPITVYKHRSRCTIESYGTAFAVEYRHLADVILHAIEWGDIT